jgi:hypothetical protein
MLFIQREFVMNAPTTEWIGQSGRSYTYWIRPIGTELKNFPGNYIIAKTAFLGDWLPIFIGQTEDLSEDFDQHDKADCIRREQATHLHAHVNNGGQEARLTEETDLIARHSPPCNGRRQRT